MSIQDLIASQKRRDGQISEGVYLAMQYRERDNELIRLYIGTKESGPMLQYETDSRLRYNGIEEVDFSAGVWTPIYSRGNFGKNYACGGIWSSHTKNLHPSVGDNRRKDITTELLIIDGQAVVLPTGIKGEVTATSLDCSVGWAVWYASASDALHNRLTDAEMIEARLPIVSKNHLVQCEKESVEKLREIITTFGI